MHSAGATESSLHACRTYRGGRIAFLLILLASNVILASSSSSSLSSFPYPSSSSLSRLKSTNIAPENVIESNCHGLSDLWGVRDNSNIFVKNTASRSSPLPFLSLLSPLSCNKPRRANRSSFSNGVIESLRGGGGDASVVDGDEEEYDDESDDDVDDESYEDSEGESNDSDTDDDSDDTSDTDAIEEDSSEGEDEDEYNEYENEYDEDSEYDEDEVKHPGKIASSISPHSKSGTQEVYDEPLVLSSMQDMGVTLGVLLLSNKLDLTNTRVIRGARFAYIAYLILAQLFLVYVRLQAHKVNDRTKITINNPLSNILKNQIGSGEGDIVKNMANSFLSSESTIMEYDLSQAKNMNSALLFPMVMLYFLHFKMGQVQPLFYQTVMGIKTVLTSPLFQVYVLGRNLERPFRNVQEDKSKQSQDESELGSELGGDREDQDGEEVEEYDEESDSSYSDDDSDDSDDSESDGESEYDDDSDEEE